MTVKSPKEYRAQARGVRQLAEPAERQALLDIAESYERLARLAAKPQAEKQSAMD